MHCQRPYLFSACFRNVLFLPRFTPLALVAMGLLTGCSRPGEREVLRLATTTTTQDSGLMDVLLPAFEEQANLRVEMVAVGTGKALQLGQAGDVDVLLAHAREQEDAFMAAGFGIRREDVMYNNFMLVGPPADPAVVRGLEAPAALAKIAAGGHTFVSRGDLSGTHEREMLLWELAGGRPEWGQYIETGQGMGNTLVVADQMQAYTLTDEGTYLRFRDQVDLVPLNTPAENLKNPYGVIVVNPDTHRKVRADLAKQFVDFLISPQAQGLIRDYKIEGSPLFFPMQPTGAN